MTFHWNLLMWISNKITQKCHTFENFHWVIGNDGTQNLFLSTDFRQWWSHYHSVCTFYVIWTNALSLHYLWFRYSSDSELQTYWRWVLCGFLVQIAIRYTEKLAIDYCSWAKADWTSRIWQPYLRSRALYEGITEVTWIEVQQRSYENLSFTDYTSRILVFYDVARVFLVNFNAKYSQSQLKICSFNLRF